MSEPDREWLKTPEGRAWLESAEGTNWIRSTAGLEWMESRDAREWLDELAQRGFDDFFSGKMPELPDWAITPEMAPQIGARVRLVAPEPTMGGTTFSEGELAIVDELRLAPAGMVMVSLRTLDGRKLLIMQPGAFEPAG